MGGTQSLAGYAFPFLVREWPVLGCVGAQRRKILMLMSMAALVVKESVVPISHISPLELGFDSYGSIALIVEESVVPNFPHFNAGKRFLFWRIEAQHR